jgi:hypothetical protein
MTVRWMTKNIPFELLQKVLSFSSPMRMSVNMQKHNTECQLIVMFILNGSLKLLQSFTADI